MLIDHASQQERAQKFAIPTSQQARLDVPFVEQSQYYCGPASLSMVSQYHGLSADQNSIADLTFVPERNGSLQVSMVAATRTLGMVPFVLTPSIHQLILEVQAGHPVIILQNNGLRLFPRWHYAVVVGYDTDRKTFLLHSGTKAFKQVDIKTLQHSHQLAERWALVALPAGQIPLTISSQQAFQAASDLESLQRTHSAQLTYSAALQRWPDNFLLHLGLGNTFMQQKQPVNACNSYRAALQINPRSAPTLNNFAYCADQIGCHRSAAEAAACAVALDNGTNPAILNTVNALTERHAAPTNAPHCPKIICISTQHITHQSGNSLTIDRNSFTSASR